MTSPSVCAHCRKPLGVHYVLKQVDSASTESTIFTVCSVLCLLQAAYTYGTVRGVQGAMLVKQTIKNLIGVMKGG